MKRVFHYLIEFVIDVAWDDKRNAPFWPFWIALISLIVAIAK